MSTNPENSHQRLVEQLSDFDTKLRANANDVALLAEVREEMLGVLVASRQTAAEIRSQVAAQCDAGNLREETFQLVGSLLDSLASESVPTSPADWSVPVAEKELLTAPNDDFGTTTIIPVGDAPANNESAIMQVQVGSVLRDRFVLQEKVSGGSMGVVYKALDKRLAESGSKEQWVAIKVLSPKLAENVEALRALQQEAAKGRSLVHPHIVRFVDLDREGDLYFIVMEWMEGKTLAEILDSNERSRIDRDAALRIFREIGDALEYAHQRGIVHADVKPGNIMILDDGSAKLFDFGVARVSQHAKSEFDPGVLGALTPAYSSMQVLTGEPPAASDDVFSLACLLYRLIAGYRVYGPRNAAEAAEAGMEAQQPQGFNDGQWRSLKKGLSYPRITRFETVREFMDALECASDDSISIEVPPRYMAEDEKPSRLSYWLLLLLLLAAGLFAHQNGYVDRWIEMLPSSAEREIVDESAFEAPAQPDTATATGSSTELPETLPPAAEVLPAPRPVVEPEVGPSSNLVDFSSLPAATLEIPIDARAGDRSPIDIVVKEDAAPVVIDFIRSGSLSRQLQLRVDEVGFSGNRSPWASGQYEYSNDGRIEFPTGQARGRIELSMASDPVREADQVSTLRLRDVDSAEAIYATLSVTLQDDDQRRFEAQLPPNTIGFAASQASIRETDPAVQIDLVRFNPDDTPFVAEFVVTDVTATQGDDYFAPSGSSVRFGPGQRSARLLIPLVQDAIVEGDEAFIMQLVGDAESSAVGVYQRIAIMIRDDEPQNR